MTMGNGRKVPLKLSEHMPEEIAKRVLETPALRGKVMSESYLDYLNMRAPGVVVKIERQTIRKVNGEWPEPPSGVVSWVGVWAVDGHAITRGDLLHLDVIRVAEQQSLGPAR